MARSRKTPEEIEISKKTRTAKATATKRKSLKGTTYTKRAIGKGEDSTDYLPDLTQIEWGEDDNLCERDKTFIYWYTTLDTPIWHNKAQCAKKIGSMAKPENLSSTGNEMYKRLKKTIDRIEGEKRSYLLTKQKEINLKNIVTRCNFNVMDFYEAGSFEDKNGNLINTLVLKPLEKMTPEQLACIDGVEFDNFGRPNYKLANREKSIDRVDKLVEAIEGKNNTDGYDVSVTVEGIKEKLETKIQIIKKNEEIASMAEGIDPETENKEL